MYVHVPFCSSPCLFCGCNRVITRDVCRGAEYLQRLLREIELVAPLFAGREASELHFGGGTPNFLNPTQLGTVVNALQKKCGLRSRGRRELSIEIDPRFIDAHAIGELAGLGFTRVSLGVQDFDADVQLAVNRCQSTEQTLATVDACRSAGIRSINIDLMYGLPQQTRESFHRTLGTIIACRPSRLAIYGYAHIPQLFKAQRRIDPASLPDSSMRIALLGMAIEELTAAGYHYIGMDHFALPEDELVAAQQSGTLQRNFMGYTTHAGCDLLGLGMSAISHVGNSYSQNFRDLRSWELAIDAGRLPIWRGIALDRDDIMRAEIISQLMCHGEVDVTRIEQRYGIDFWSYFASARRKLLDLQNHGLVWLCASRIIATSQGRYLLRLLAGCFDRYLDQASVTGEPAASRFSKLI